MKSKSDKRVKMTLLLDERSIEALRAYSYTKFGVTNISKAIMEMAKDYDKQHNNRES